MGPPLYRWHSRRVAVGCTALSPQRCQVQALGSPLFSALPSALAGGFVGLEWRSGDRRMDQIRLNA